jgi:hypothetical protein
MTPEDVGINSLVAVFQPVGRDVVVRNCRVWGFHEYAIDLRGAAGFRFYNNTVAYYQQLGDTFFDATDATDIQISNNVFLALTDDVGALVGASSLTEDLRVAGNVIEGAGAIVIGAQPGAPSIVVENNPLGEAPLQAPHFPRFHADAAVEIDLTAPAAGTSLDGVELASVTSPLPGAYQTRSTLSGPRRMVTTVGGGSCGGGPCDVNPAEENATQIAVWSTWPGGTVELYPGTHSGAVISWPMNLRGTAWDEVTVERNPQGFLNAFRFFSRHPSVIRVTEHLRAAVEVSELTIAVGPDETGLTVEGTDASAPPSPNVVQRVRVIDRGDTDGDLAEVGFWLGHHVVLHDALVLGGFQICVRHGVRDGTYDETPPSTNWVYNLTCRQTKTVTDQPLSGFEVASVSGSQWFNIALELAEAGPLFRAQRRAWSDRPELDSGPVALDAPSSFTATAWVLRGRSDDYDGFSDAQGTFVQTDVDDLSPNDPFFISPTDSHLAPGAAGIDAGVDPVSIDASLLPGTDLDGIPRSGAVIDRGAYEQGS